MAKQPAGGFAELLQRLRIGAGMTQDELAKAAELSPRTVSDLERGINRTARKDTAELLATALGLTGDERGQFLATARGGQAAAERPAGAEAAEALEPALGGEPLLGGEAGRGGRGPRRRGRLQPGLARLGGHRELRGPGAGARRPG